MTPPKAERMSEERLAELRERALLTRWPVSERISTRELREAFDELDRARAAEAELREVYESDGRGVIDERDALLAERDALRAELDQARAGCNNAKNILRSARDKAEARVKELEGALRERGNHGDGCAAVKVIGRFGSRVGLHWTPGDEWTCDCGLACALLAAPQEPEKP